MKWDLNLPNGLDSIRKTLKGKSERENTSKRKESFGRKVQTLGYPIPKWGKNYDKEFI